YPIFNGRYSTYCYVDSVLRATREAAKRLQVGPRELFSRATACLFHRPYHLMPIQAMAVLQLWVLASVDRPGLSEVCEGAGVDVDAVLGELEVAPDLVR